MVSFDPALNNHLSRLLAADNINLIIQLFLLTILIFYALFSLLVLKQVAILNKSIKTPGGEILNFVALVHTLASFILLAVVIFTLF